MDVVWLLYVVWILVVMIFDFIVVNDLVDYLICVVCVVCDVRVIDFFEKFGDVVKVLVFLNVWGLSVIGIYDVVWVVDVVYVF